MTNYSSSATPDTSQTYQHPWYTQQSLLENTTTYECQSQQNQKPETVGLKSTDTSRKGDYWEAFVEMAAWERNADVYPNKGCTGSVDMVLGIDGDFIPVDVKAMRWDARFNSWTSKGSVPTGIYVVLVNPETKEIRWRKNLDKTPRCPKGLEDFWD